MSRLQNNIWFVVAIVFAVSLTVFALSNFVLHPSEIFAELGGDGCKNSFTYLYHSMYGKGYWFEGMNYPYGEHIVFTDGQPVLSVLLASLGNVTAGTALSVFWLLLGFSYVLTILFVYKILVHFKVAPLAAMLFAGLICVCNPQVLRLQSHYALSYTCIIPMLFYWTIRYTEQFSWRYCIWVFITGCIMSFLHPYYVAIMLVWVMSYAAGYIIFSKGSFLSRFKHVLPLCASVMVVLVMVAVVMKVTDPITDRPTTPLSWFAETCTRIKQIITSALSPLWQGADGKPRYKFVAEGGEGYTYPGIAVLLTAGICAVVGLWRSIKAKRISIVAGDTGFSVIWLFMAVVVLLFGMGIPFIWNMEWLLDYLAAFRQFRSLGRFSWIFYYIITIYTAVVLYAGYARLKGRRKFVAAFGVLLLSLGLWAWEARGFIRFTRGLSDMARYNYTVFFQTNEKNWETFLKEHNFKSDNFQAVLLLPYYHIGTEKIWVGDPGWINTLGCRAALQLHLPIVDVMMSRSSWSQAKEQVKIAAGRFVEKPILGKIKSDKPFLLMHIETDSLNPDQKYLLEASDLIGDFSQCKVYACYPARLAAGYKAGTDSINQILPFVSQPDTLIGSRDNVYMNHMDGFSAKPLFGAGAARGCAREDSIIETLTIAPVKEEKMYEYSCWFLLDSKDYRSAYIALELLDSSGNVIDRPDALTKQSTDNSGMWFRASAFFKLKTNCTAIRCRLINTPAPAYLALDEIQLRPVETLIISKTADGKVMVNNHLFNGKQIGK